MLSGKQLVGSRYFNNKLSTFYVKEQCAGQKSFVM